MAATEVKWLDSLGFGNRDRACGQLGKREELKIPVVLIHCEHCHAGGGSMPGIVKRGPSWAAGVLQASEGTFQRKT